MGALAAFRCSERDLRMRGGMVGVAVAVENGFADSDLAGRYCDGALVQCMDHRMECALCPAGNDGLLERPDFSSDAKHICFE